MTTHTNERDLQAARHVGARVNQMLWDRRITKTVAAHAAGITTSTFSKKLRGTVPITVDEVVRLASVLNVQPGELLPSLADLNHVDNRAFFDPKAVNICGYVPRPFGALAGPDFIRDAARRSGVNQTFTPDLFVAVA